MPNKCCVPGCKSNYLSSPDKHVPLYSFPRDDQLRQLWLRKIPRANFIPTKYSFVCIKHFDERFVMRGGEVAGRGGRPTLSPFAYPTIFPSSASGRIRVARKRTAGLVPGKTTVAFEEPVATPPPEPNPDAIRSFEELLLSAESRLAPQRVHGWCFVPNSEWFLIANLSCDASVPAIRCALRIASDLSVTLILREHRLTQEELERMGWVDQEIHSWNQILHCMQLLKSTAEGLDVRRRREEGGVELDAVVSMLRSFHEDVVSGKRRLQRENDARCLAFIAEQLEHLDKRAAQRKYSCELIMWTLSVLLRSPAVYNAVRDSGVVILPQECTLKRIVMQMNGKLSGAQFGHLERKAKSLPKEARIVCLKVYDIPVRSPSALQEGPLALFGKATTRLKAFLISSIFAAFKEIVFLTDGSADGRALASDVRNTISELERTGFHVLSVIVDNTEANRTMFAQLSSGEMNICVPHPMDASRPLFLMFDAANVLRCIRDDWIDQKSITQTLAFPNPDGVGVLHAHFSVIKSLYDVERKNYATGRYAKRLTCKTVSPGKSDRDDPELVLNVFDEGTVKALEALGPSEARLLGWEGTAAFVKTVLGWWATVRSALVESAADPCMALFNDLIVWLNKWDELGDVGRLSDTTSQAFQHTLHALREIVAYLLTEAGAKSVRLSSFRKDFLGFA